MVEISLAHKYIEAVFDMALFTLSGEVVLMRIVMARFTVVKCQVAKLLKFFSISSGGRMALFAIYDEMLPS